MADARCYRGYVTLNTDENAGLDDRWVIRFPDFPDIVIKAGKEALDPTGICAERCCTAVMNAVAVLLKEGREIPTPQEFIEHSWVFDIQIDIDLFRSLYRLKN